MAGDAFKPCNRTAGFICSSLAAVADEATLDRRRGIKLWIFSSPERGVVQAFAGYKDSTKDPGQVFTHCPFCGQEIVETVEGKQFGYQAPLTYGKKATAESPKKEITP